MKFKVAIHPDAMEDITRNACWWSDHHSQAQAQIWYDHAIDSLWQLEESPQQHPLSSENNDFPYEIRDFLFGLGSRPSYRAIFTIRENVVHVLTIQRASQDAIVPEDIHFE